MQKQVGRSFFFTLYIYTHIYIYMTYSPLQILRAPSLKIETIRFSSGLNVAKVTSSLCPFNVLMHLNFASFIVFFILEYRYKDINYYFISFFTYLSLRWKRCKRSMYDCLYMRFTFSSKNEFSISS